MVYLRVTPSEYISADELADMTETHSDKSYWLPALPGMSPTHWADWVNATSSLCSRERQIERTLGGGGTVLDGKISQALYCGVLDTIEKWIP